MGVRRTLTWGAVDYYEKNVLKEVVEGVFATTSYFSDRAKSIGQAFQLLLLEEQIIVPFPIIKCKKYSENRKLYYLPTDRGYDEEVTMDLLSGDFYCGTVKEAENKGFRQGEERLF